jgi:uncharacterized protein (TIGR00369 family)
VEDVHLNGNGTLHGGVYASLLDNAMGLSVAALVGLRTATIGLDVHFLGAVREGRITCSAEVVHRTRRIATVEAKVLDTEGNLVALARHRHYPHLREEGRPYRLKVSGIRVQV